MIGKRQKFGPGNYEWIELTEEEAKEAIGKAIEWNLKVSLIFDEVADEVKKNMVEKGLIKNKKDLPTNTPAIYDAVKVDSYTILKNKLDKKISDRFEEEYGKDTKTQPEGSGSSVRD